MWREQLPLLRLDGLGVALQGLHAARHDGERLVLPAVPFPHPRKDVQVAADVHPAPSLHDGDASVIQQSGQLADRVVPDDRPVLQLEPVPGPACGTADGLVMEPPVRRVGVLASALGTHREGVHGGQRTVVRHPSEKGEAGPAARAGGEGIAGAPPFPEDLREAFVAHGAVRRDGCSASAVPGGRYGESAPPGEWYVRLLDRIYPR